jgi:hypothetical protein
MAIEADVGVVQISLEGPALVYKTQVSVVLAQRVILMITKSQMGEPIEDSEEKNGSARQNFQGAPNEFVQAANPVRHLDKITALAVYLKRARSQDSFSADDIKKLYPAAGLGSPSSLYRELNKAVRAGFIAKHEDGSYYVTGTGETATDQSFPADLVKPIRRRKGKRGGRASSTDPADLTVDADESESGAANNLGDSVQGEG